MVDRVAPNQRDELFNQWEDEKKDVKKNTLLNIPPIQLFFLVILVGYMVYLVYKKVMTLNSALPIIIILIVFILLLAWRNKKKSDIISEREAKAILYNELRWKQQNSPDEIPNGNIMIMLDFRLRKVEAKPIKYEIAFRIVEGNGRYSLWVGAIDCYTGMFLEAFPRPEGWGHKDAPDIIKVFPDIDIFRKKNAGLFNRGGGGGQQGPPPTL